MLITSLPITKAETQRKIVQIPGDLVLGGLFPMHEQVILSWIFLSLFLCTMFNQPVVGKINLWQILWCFKWGEIIQYARVTKEKTCNPAKEKKFSIYFCPMVNDDSDKII